MPGNENNNPFNNEFNNNNQQTNNMPNMSNQPEQKPIIEIPQEYYDKLAQEELAKKEQQAKLERDKAAAAESASELNKILVLVILNAIIIFVSLYLTVNKTKYALFAIPIFIVILSIFHSLKYKEKSSYSSSVMVGGILVAVITFVISMLNEEEMDLWTYYAIVSAGIGFLGVITSSIINKIIVDFKNIKALQAIGYIIYFIALIIVPKYLNDHYHEEFYKLIFKEQTEVVAETETEFVLKTLKQRYDTTFICGTYANQVAQQEKNLKEGTYNSKIDQHNRRVSERFCLDENKREIRVISTSYNESAVQYIVVDDYIEKLFLDNIKENISKNVLSTTGTKEVDVSLYPEENCSFYGDCVDCDDYYSRYEKENDIKNQYGISTKLNFTKDLKKSPLEYINGNKFKYVINISGQFNNISTNYESIIENVLKSVNSLEYKNNYGYIISIYNIDTAVLETKQLVYKVIGDTNSEKTFKDPKIQNISSNKNKN